VSVAQLAARGLEGNALVAAVARATGSDEMTARRIVAVELGGGGCCVALDERGRPVPRRRRQITDLR
jgi:hypothetical protein